MSSSKWNQDSQGTINNTTIITIKGTQINNSLMINNNIRNIGANTTRASIQARNTRKQQPNSPPSKTLKDKHPLKPKLKINLNNQINKITVNIVTITIITIKIITKTIISKERSLPLKIQTAIINSSKITIKPRKNKTKINQLKF